MHKLFLFISIYFIIVTSIFFRDDLVFAQQIFRSNCWSTKVGETNVADPCGSGATGKFSCPIPDGRITCASYGPVFPGGSGFWGLCQPDSTGNGGHCNNNYIYGYTDPSGKRLPGVGICINPPLIGPGGNLLRTAKSIDITKRGGSHPGDPIYLPSINGQNLKWRYKGSRSAGAGFGGMRLFESEQTPQGIWSIHFVHVSQDLPEINVGQELNTGDVGGILANLGGGEHVHVTVGVNIGDSTSNMQDHHPNWKFPDRELGMCLEGPANPNPQPD